MAEKSSIPEDVRKYIPCKCCKIRNDHGVYRVYKYSAVKLPSGKWSSSSWYLIGKILPGQGFIPNKRYAKELEDRNESSSSDSFTDVSYGRYALLMAISEDILEKLNQCFPAEKAAQIYAYALILCANGFLPMEQIDDFYAESFLSLVYRKHSLDMGHTALSRLLCDIGIHGNPVYAFERSLADGCAGRVAVCRYDVRHIASWLLPFKADGIPNFEPTPEVKVFAAYDVKNRRPLLCRAYRDFDDDEDAVYNFLGSLSAKNAELIVGRDFFTERILKEMSQDNNRYIVPVPPNDRNFKRIWKTIAFTSGKFVYGAEEKDWELMVFHEEQISKNTRMIIYRDEDENNRSCKNYLRKIALGEGGYTQEKYEKSCGWWGVRCIQTTSDASAADIYADSMLRGSLEIFGDYLQNAGAFEGLMPEETDYCTNRGFDFILLVTALIYSKLSNAVQALADPCLSVSDILLKANRLHLVLEGDVWKLHNAVAKDLELFRKIGFTPLSSYVIS